MNNDPAVLLLIQSDSVGVSQQSRWFDPKTLSGLRIFSQQWPGRLIVAAPSIDGPGGEHHKEVATSDLGFDLLLDRDPASVAHTVNARVALALHAPTNYSLLRWKPNRTVFTLENGVSQRLRMALLQASSHVERARTRVGAARLAPSFYASIRQAAGIQCNGYSTWSKYRHLNRAPLLFFDHRVPESVIAQSSAVHPSEEGPLRLGFSGRHIVIKGPRFAIDLVDDLRERGVDAHMTMYGDGPLRSSLERNGSPHVTFVGSLPFRDEWITSVRQNIDLMVLPYPQADPAGTYLETFALGVPVLGFTHSTFAPFARQHGAGWAVPIGSRSALAETAELLSADRSLLTSAGHRALGFMASHPFEHEFSLRVNHLRTIGQV